MKRTAKIGDEQFALELTRDGDSVRAIIDGREYSLEVGRPEPGVVELRDAETKFSAFVHSGDDGARQVTTGGETIEVMLIDPRKLRGSHADTDLKDGLAEIKTAMPGKVVRIVTPEGAEVLKGDSIVVVEAMKMQNELRSPKDGVVRSVKVSEGDTVNAGQVLAVVE